MTRPQTELAQTPRTGRQGSVTLAGRGASPRRASTEGSWQERGRTPPPQQQHDRQPGAAAGRLSRYVRQGCGQSKEAEGAVASSSEPAVYQMCTGAYRLSGGQHPISALHTPEAYHGQQMPCKCPLHKQKVHHGQLVPLVQSRHSLSTLPPPTPRQGVCRNPLRQRKWARCVSRISDQGLCRLQYCSTPG